MQREPASASSTDATYTISTEDPCTIDVSFDASAPIQAEESIVEDDINESGHNLGGRSHHKRGSRGRDQTTCTETRK